MYQSIIAARRPTAVQPLPLPTEERNPHLDRLLRRLPPAISQALTPDQVAALGQALMPAPPRHSLDFQVSLPAPGGYWYVTVLAGRDRRNRARLSREGRLRPGRQAAVAGLLIWLAASLLVAGGMLLVIARPALERILGSAL